MSDVSVANDYGRATHAASVRLLLLSVVLWAVGVITIRLAAPLGMFAPRLAPLLFLATVPLAWATVDLARRVADGRHGLFEATATTCVPALLLDGLALTWAQPIYGLAALPLQAPAAWLLWFVGVSLAVAMWQRMRHIATAG